MDEQNPAQVKAMSSATGLFDPNKPVPQEVINQFLNISNADEQRRDLDKQMALSQRMMTGATDFRNMPGQNAIGGLANAAAQGIMGYKGATMAEKDRAERARLNQDLIAARRTAYDMQNRPAMGSHSTGSDFYE